MTEEITVFNPVKNESALVEYKSGKNAKGAYTPSALMRAPVNARVKLGDSETLRLINNGRYIPFIKDVTTLLNKKQIEALEAFLSNKSPAPEGPLLGRIVIKLAEVTQINKAGFRLVCEWLSNPTEFAKVEGQLVERPAPLPKTKQWLSDIAKVWLSTNPA